MVRSFLTFSPLPQRNQPQRSRVPLPIGPIQLPGITFYRSLEVITNQSPRNRLRTSHHRQLSTSAYFRLATRHAPCFESNFESSLLSRVNHLGIWNSTKSNHNHTSDSVSPLIPDSATSLPRHYFGVSFFLFVFRAVPKVILL